MSVKAKFKCYSVVDIGYAMSASFGAIYGTEGENADYAKATPAGNLNITIDRETKASEYFKQGKDYYLTFNEVE